MMQGFQAPATPALTRPILAMPDITLIEANGTEHSFEAPEGISVMQAATGFGVPGIVAECGGSAICATCHVMVDESWIARLPAPLANELEMLECTASQRTPGSRLSCQIQLTADLQGLVMRVPERQY
jgi:2Fe-2S ferredoxin